MGLVRQRRQEVQGWNDNDSRQLAMFKGNRNLIVGAFVAVAIVGVGGLAMWLAGRQSTEPVARYSLLFENDISGLSLGGSVFYMGVNVGEVTETVLVVDEKVRVRVDIEVLKSTPIDSGTTASLDAQGITGITVINLSGNAGSKSKLSMTPGFEYPLIPIKQTGLGALLEAAPKLLNRISTLLDQANEILGEENRASLNRTLSNIESLTSTFAENEETLTSLPGELTDTLREVRVTVDQFQKIADQSGPEFIAAVSNVNRATERLASLTMRVDNWMGDNEEQMQHFIENGLGQTPDLIADARAMMRQLEKLLRQLQDNPSQLIHRPIEESLEVSP